MRTSLWMFGWVCLFQACTAQPAAPVLTENKDGNTLLWEVSGKNLQQPSYLFGTFHVMCKGDIHFSPSLHSAFQYAGEVYMEMDMDDPAVLLGGMFMMGMKGGMKLKDLYSADEYQRVISFFKDSLHTPIHLLESTKPYFLMALLYPRMMSCKQLSGVEEELVKLARSQRKNISGLETLEFQSSVFDSIPYQVQAKELLKNIDSLHAYRSYFDTMVRQYKTQQLDAMQGMFGKTELGLEDYLPLLLDQRNERWVDSLQRKMPFRSIFMAVGAGHLPGEKGLIALLKKQGYRVRPVKNE